MRYIEIIEKFNPYHSTVNGQFTSGTEMGSFAPTEGKTANGQRLLGMYKEGHKGDVTIAPKRPPGNEAAVAKTLKTAEDKIRHDKVETAFVVGRDGKVLLERSDGEKDYVSFTQEQFALMKGNILSHNHPSGTTFSAEDINAFEMTQLQQVRATTASGKTYTLTRTGAANTAKEPFAVEYKRENNRYKLEVTDPLYQKSVAEYDRNKISDSEFRQVLGNLNSMVKNNSHEWLAKNAPKFGAIYEVEGG